MVRLYERGECAFGLGAFSRIGQLVYGILIPTWQSLKALKSQQTDDDTQLLTYWTLFGLTILFERMFAFLVYVFPLYYEIKAVFLAWLIHMKGAQRVYAKFVDPYFDYVQRFVEDGDYRRKQLTRLKDFCKKLTQSSAKADTGAKKAE